MKLLYKSDNIVSIFNHSKRHISIGRITCFTYVFKHYNALIITANSEMCNDMSHCKIGNRWRYLLRSLKSDKGISTIVASDEEKK